MYDTDMLLLGKNLKDLRKARGMSLQDLGNIIGKSKSCINRYETGKTLMDILTIIEICNALNVDINELCQNTMHGTEKDINKNPFNSNLLYLYYISKNGVVLSSLEINEKTFANYVLMKNGIINKRHKQEYTGVIECNYNTAFICLTNAINNPGLDKFQIEVDLHSKVDNMYFGIFLGISDYSHSPTARKCIITSELITNKDRLEEIFEKLKINELEIKNMLKRKYWDMRNIETIDTIDFVMEM